MRQIQTITYSEYRGLLINTLLLSINTFEENDYLKGLRNAIIDCIHSINTDLLEEQRTGIITISAMCLERELLNDQVEEFEEFS